MTKDVDVEDFASSQSILLGTLISESVYSVPSLQRNYSWSTEEADDLWTDIAQHISSKDDYYFLGNIIYFATPEGRVVVDGQQRLATTTILLCAARDAIRESVERGAIKPGTDVAVGGDEISLTDHISQITGAIKELGKRGKFRLSLKQKDEERLRWIQTDSERRGRQPHGRGKPKIYRVYNSYREASRDLVSRGQLDELCSITHDLLNGVVVTRTKVPNLLTAYTIFSTTNNRGKDLTLADIVRAELLHRWQNLGGTEEPADLISMLNQFDLLDYEELPQFMRRYWILRNGKKSTPASTSKEVMNAIQSIPTKKALRAFVSEMSESVEAYAEFLEIVSTSPESEIARRLSMFSISGFQQHIPAFVALIHRDEIEESTAEDLLSTIESIYLYHNILEDASPSAVEDMFAVLAHRVYKDGAEEGRQQLIESFEKLTGKLLEKPDWFVWEFSSAQLTDRAASFILRRIEKSRWTKELKFDLYRPRALNLEHILPQVPNPAEWPAEWKEDDQLNQFLSLPGNLTLLAQPLNGHLQNSGFAKKKREGYAKSNLKLTQELLGFKTWDEKTIRSRSRVLAKEAAALWSWDEVA